MQSVFMVSCAASGSPSLFRMNEIRSHVYSTLYPWSQEWALLLLRPAALQTYKQVALLCFVGSKMSLERLRSCKKLSTQHGVTIEPWLAKWMSCQRGTRAFHAVRLFQKVDFSQLIAFHCGWPFAGHILWVFNICPCPNQLVPMTSQEDRNAICIFSEGRHKVA